MKIENWVMKTSYSNSLYLFFYFFEKGLIFFIFYFFYRYCFWDKIEISQITQNPKSHTLSTHVQRLSYQHSPFISISWAHPAMTSHISLLKHKTKPCTFSVPSCLFSLMQTLSCMMILDSGNFQEKVGRHIRFDNFFTIINVKIVSNK